MQQGGRFNPPGEIVSPLHTVTIAGFTTRQRVPGVIVYVRQCAKWIREFERFCDHHGIARVYNEDGESVCGTDAWECIAPDDLLARLTEHPSVRDWHPVIGCSVDMRGSGAGPEKLKTGPGKHKANRWDNGQREFDASGTALPTTNDPGRDAMGETRADRKRDAVKSLDDTMRDDIADDRKRVIVLVWKAE